MIRNNVLETQHLKALVGLMSSAKLYAFIKRKLHENNTQTHTE